MIAPHFITFTSPSSTGSILSFILCLQPREGVQYVEKSYLTLLPLCQYSTSWLSRSDMLQQRIVYRCCIHVLTRCSLHNVLKLVLGVVSELQIQWLLSLFWTLSLQGTPLTDTYSFFSFQEPLCWVSLCPSDQNSGVFCLNVSLVLFLPPSSKCWRCPPFRISPGVSITVFCKEFIHLHGFSLHPQKRSSLGTQCWPLHWASGFYVQWTTSHSTETKQHLFILNTRNLITFPCKGHFAFLQNSLSVSIRTFSFIRQLRKLASSWIPSILPVQWASRKFSFVKRLQPVVAFDSHCWSHQSLIDDIHSLFKLP